MDLGILLDRLILTGNTRNLTIKSAQDINVTEDDIDASIYLIEESVYQNPNLILTKVLLSVESHMVPLVMAILFAQAKKDFLQDPNTRSLSRIILGALAPDRMLEFAEYLKSKYFGRGLGSRPQKVLRLILENYDASNILLLIDIFPNSFYSLIKMLHPKFTGEEGEIIKQFLYDYTPF